MFEPTAVPAVGDDERICRFILQSNQFANNLVSHRAFLPYKYVELSVNRHSSATDSETWQAGKDVAAKRGRTLYGRADISTRDCKAIDLAVISDPVEPEDGFAGNPNHAIIVGFPSEKHEQMSHAQSLAEAANKQGGFCKV